MTKSVAILIDDICQSGGTERVASILSNELSKEQHVFLYSLNIHSSPFYNLSPKVVLKTSSSLGRIKKKLDFISFIKKENIHSVIIISMGRLSAEMAFFMGFLGAKSKLILSEHVAFESFPTYIKFIKLLSYKYADNVVVLTENDKDLLNHKYGLKNVSLIKNISSFYHVKNTVPIKERQNIAIAIGRLSYQKNFERLLFIWSKAIKKDWRLIIIGDGDNTKLVSMIEELNISDSVELLPAQQNISGYYNNAKIFLMTSRYEGLPMVLIECKNYGIPSISFNCKTGPAEIIVDKEDGYLIDYNDDDDFINKLSFLISDDELISRMSKSALIRSSLFSPEIIIPKWDNIIG
ncbi:MULTISPECIES: glycosyltransferase family 4 protein [Pectobacterium]|uniref:glycosyltransferase family 4 protein n=1 Tax=Pectobacterium TaxID=122277 RepID=UPI0005834996|nr:MULTISPECIES: glycosyltransferase family 4 protein [Pectobacterium]KHS85094.1 hypothetical protein RC84_06145 [Pectobacterium carotovorum subsp. carotovorum]MDE8742016.1 glycosyltransferase family 4 protein [Pectobacterium polaris]